MEEMTNVCRSCDLKSKYKYWHEIPPTKKSFFKVMYDNFHDQMRIPMHFMNHFNGKLGEWCILRGPSGKEWRVRKTQALDTTLFTHGWDKFVIDNGIMPFDYLVFSYYRDSSFQVSIYKKSGCERESAYFSENLSSEESRGTCFTSFHTRQDREDDNDDSNSLCLSGKSSEDDDFVVSSRKRGQQGSTSRGHKQRQTVYISRRRDVTLEEEERAINLANNFMVDEKSGRPMIMLKLCPTHVYQGFHLTISKKWAKKHLWNVDHEVNLRVPEIEVSWTIKCRWTSHQQCQFISGWSKFVLDNNLEDHDVCVFELICKGDPNKRKRSTMDVHIFRVVDQVVPLKKVRISN